MYMDSNPGLFACLPPLVNVLERALLRFFNSVWISCREMTTQSPDWRPG